MKAAGLDALAVYGDREHFANIAYLTGFDPRFEEALLLLDRLGRRMLVVGNECLGYLPDAALKLEVELFQDFSLMGQPRDASRPLREILRDFGIGPAVKVGCIGWKLLDARLSGDASFATEIPSYIVDLLRGLAGSVCNATGLLMGVRDGLRLINPAAQIAQFEFAATRTSESIRRLIEHIRVGVAECELAVHLDGGGLPLSCHPMIGFGAKAQRGLSSPSGNRARLGDAFTAAFGVVGALTCRAGAVAHGPEDLPPELRSFFPRFVGNYFDLAARWYEAVKIGAVAGDVYDAVESVRNADLFSLAVNPGHYIHLDEWVHSPFEAGGGVELRSGMALQMDCIPVSAGPFCYANAEDGVVLADAALREELKREFPGCLKRMLARQAWMRNAVGIAIDDSALPLGNTSGWLAPYALSPQMALVSR